MYMPGRLRTASSPSSTVIDEAPYSGTEVPTAAWAAGSCLVVPFKGFRGSFLTRTPHAHKPVAALQVPAVSREFGTRPTLRSRRPERSGVDPRRPFRTAQNTAQIREHGRVGEQGARELATRPVGQGEDPAGCPPARLFHGLDLRPEHPFFSPVEGAGQLRTG